MVDTIKSRPNHYEVLGLKPSATAEEINRAFNRELHRPRPFGGLALLGVAFETLKDPAKRRAYDASIGIVPPPEPKLVPAAFQNRFQYIIAPPRPASERPAFSLPKVPVQQASSPVKQKHAPEPEPAAERRTQPFIAAPERTAVEPKPQPQPRAQPAPGAAPLAEFRPPERVVVEPPLDDVEDGPILSRRIGLTVGGVALAAIALGAWAGTSVQDSGAPEDALPAMTMSLPPATTKAALGDPAPAASVVDVQPEANRVRVVEAPAKRAIPRPIPLTAEEERQLAGNQFVESVTQQLETTAPAAEQAAVETPAATVAAASLPLPNRVVARTIQRIGYPCGQVASTTALEGGGTGVFKVTCTSGHSYQATPVRGRYRFRRLGG